jgi:hypothetical protein
MNDKDQIQHEQILETIANLNAQTAKFAVDLQKTSKELKWYDIMVIVAVTLAIVAITKLFL